MLHTVGVANVNKKNEIISLVFMFPSQFMVLKLHKKVHFLQFYADFSKKPKSVKTTYILYLKVLIHYFRK